ncbi:MAG: 1-acyl-sn-glycerol-3-phosphate acyltransferase [Bacteroidales bacterium]|nr:1-acyl-sn-glycerol-3-phosphate acyltransferase [Bacteroidales bacterium]MBP5758098.1 1-acyl-sn-glycerol-3-phosphate acyltransferase [Bacteroidales bacterium]
MSREIYHNGLFYRLVKLLVNFGLRAYFGRIVVKGRENLPSDGSYILAPNHQNAFLDALMILQINKLRPTVFLARADIFGNTLADKVLHFLKIMPVYRARDGRKSLEKNDITFEKSLQVLLHNVPFCIMAEGTHNDRRQLLPLKKGIFRIAFAAQQKLGNKPLYIVPVGIDYESYDTSGNSSIINIGQPIAMKDYIESYQDNNALAINKIKEDLRVAMTAQMHQIDSTEHYDEFYLFSKLYADARGEGYGGEATWRKFELRRKMSQKLDGLEQLNPQNGSDMAKEISDTSTLCSAYGVNSMRLFETKSVVETVVGTILLAGIPVAFALLNWRLLVMLLLLCPIPFLPTRLLFRNQSDQQFVGSLNFAVQFVLVLLYLLAMTITVGLLQGWGYAAAALVAGIAVWRTASLLGSLVKRLFIGWKILFFKQKTANNMKEKLDGIFKKVVND